MAATPRSLFMVQAPCGRQGLMDSGRKQPLRDSTLTAAGNPPASLIESEASLSWCRRATAPNTSPVGSGGKLTMAKYCVPIMAVRHGHVTVEAESEHDALAKGWDAIKANTYTWLFEPSFSVEKPFVAIT